MVLGYKPLGSTILGVIFLYTLCLRNSFPPGSLKYNTFLNSLMPSGLDLDVQQNQSTITRSLSFYSHEVIETVTVCLENCFTKGL